MAKQQYAAIWHVVSIIPVGKVASYGQVADLAGLPGRARMVGKVLGAAPAGQPVPWFRVLRSNGQIAFPKGSALALRQAQLLREEGVEVRNHRVSMRLYGWQPGLDILLFGLDY